MVNPMRRRGANRGVSFRRAGQQKSKGKSFSIVDGKFEYFNPSATATWIHIPIQKHTYDIWDRESREVETRTDQPFLEYISHGVPKGNTPVGAYRSFTCSSGAHKDKPCYGCAIRRDFYDEKRRMEDKAAEEGVEPKDMGYAPISGSSKTAQSIVIMELMYAVPATNKKGQIKKSKRGDVIYNHIPHSQINLKASELDQYVATYGRKMHWSYGNQYFEMLQGFDEELSTLCGNCAEPLLCKGFMCPGCETEHLFDEPVAEEDFLIELGKVKSCNVCDETEDHESGELFIPIVACPGCGDAVQGRLVGDFDLRIKSVSTGDNSSVIKLVGVRPTGSALKKDQVERYEELVEKPMDLKAIFAPSDLGWQKRCIHERLLAGVNPSMAKKEMTKEYTTADFDGGLPEGL